MRRSSRKTLLLTGASGVVGQALLTKVLHHDVICLVHRTPVAVPGVMSLRGDIASPRFGLTREEWRNLAGRIDCVVHSAAITSFFRPDEMTFRTNVGGTENVLDLAAAAQAPLYHISTAFVHPCSHGRTGGEPNAYERSKREAERIVRESGLPISIVRPSVVVGDSQTGAIAQFQGLHLLVGLFMQGMLPVAPAAPGSYVDLIPQDVVASAIAGLIDREHIAADYWLTSGSRALTLGDTLALCVKHAHQLVGHAIPYPRMVTSDVFDRLIAPVFLPALPAQMQRTINRALRLSKYLMLEEQLPSSLPELELQLECPLGFSPETVFLRNLEYWASRQRLDAQLGGSYYRVREPQGVSV